MPQPMDQKNRYAQPGSGHNPVRGSKKEVIHLPMIKKNKSSKSKHETPTAAQPKKDFFREIFEIAMYGLCLLLFFKSFSWQNFQIPTSSMENTLLIGDHITANTFMFKNAGPIERTLFPFRDVKRGDVIVFKWPGNVKQDWIKRCIGLPGDRFELKMDRVFINDEPLEEPYPFYKVSRKYESDRDPEIGYRPRGYYSLKPGLEHAEERTNVSLDMRRIRAKTKEKLALYRKLDPEIYRNLIERLENGPMDTIPEGFYFMMGDNRNRSMDSRSWGLVPKELIQGRAYFCWWSYGEDESSHELTGFPLIWSYLRVPFTFWSRTHWQETFSRIK